MKKPVFDETGLVVEKGRWYWLLRILNARRAAQTALKSAKLPEKRNFIEAITSRINLTNKIDLIEARIATLGARAESCIQRRALDESSDRLGMGDRVPAKLIARAARAGFFGRTSLRRIST